MLWWLFLGSLALYLGAIALVLIFARHRDSLPSNERYGSTVTRTVAEVAVLLVGTVSASMWVLLVFLFVPDVFKWIDRTENSWLLVSFSLIAVIPLYVPTFVGLRRTMSLLKKLWSWSTNRHLAMLV